MRILHVIASLSRKTGGPAKAVRELSELLVRRGHQVSIFSLQAADSFLDCEDKIKSSGVAVRLFPRAGLGKYGYSPSLKRALERELDRFDLVHIHGLWVYPTLAASRLCQKRKIPYVIRPCGMLDRFSMSQHPLRKRLYRRLFEDDHLRKASAVHFTSRAEEQRSVLEFVIRGAVVPLGIRWEDYENLPPYGTFRRDYPEWEGKKIVLFLGRIHYKKGLDLLIEAFDEVRKLIPRLHFALAGPDEEGYGPILKDQIHRRGLERHVSWMGYVEGGHKLALLRDSDVFCLPSRQENFGFSVLEAMAAGLPVIVSDQVNIHDVIRRENAGLVVPCQSQSIVLALKEVLCNHSWRIEAGERGRALVRCQFTWNAVGEGMISFYDSVVKSSPWGESENSQCFEREKSCDDAIHR